MTAGTASRSGSTGMLLGDIANRGASQFGDRAALVWDGGVRTYREMADRVHRLCAALAAAGAGPGSRIAVLSPNTPEVIETYFASALLGSIVVPLNIRLRAEDIRFQMEDSGAEHAVWHPAVEHTAKAAGLLERTNMAIGPELDAALARIDPVDGKRAERVPDDSPAMQLYTSGTTGRPKGCLLSHRGWIASNANLAHAYGITGADRLVAVYPFFHVAGFGLAATHLMAGATVVLAASPDPAELWSLVARHHATFAGFPGLRHALADPGAARAGASLRIVYGGAGMETVETLETVREVAPNSRWAGIYGSTESGNVVATSTLDDEREHPGTVGRPLLGFDVAILSEADQPLPPGEVGELGLRGPSTMLGYAGLAADTAAATRGGWLHTGDLMRHDDGLLYFVDRVKDMIKSGGENVYSIEVEAVLAGHPDVLDVAVIGVPDQRWGEAVKAVLVRRDGTAADLDALDGFCLQRLAGYKRPRWYEFVDDIPRSQTGKIVKRELRAAHDPARALRIGEQS